MDEKVKTTEIKIKDFYGDNCLGDSVGSPDDQERSPKGYVEIYEILDDGKKHLLGKHNLVLYIGREWIAQRLVDENNTNLASPSNSTKNDILAWFGLGSGGVDPADPFIPVAPVITETDLNTRVMINATDSSNADYHVVSAGYPEEGYYKAPFDSVAFEQDALNSSKWLVLKITITIGVDDANLKQLSEAGLFVNPSKAGGATGNFTIFSRVTFPSMVKTSDRRLIFVWYLYV